MRLLLPTLFVLCLAMPAAAENGIFFVDADTRIQDLQPYMLYLPDEAGAFTLETALARHEWQPLPNSTLGYRNYPVWTRITLRSRDAGSHQYILNNPRPATNLLDIYVSGDKGGYTKHELGILRPVANQTLRHRFTALPLTVPADRPVTVVTRVYSAGPLDVGWVLSAVSEFYVWTIGENLLRGLVGGAMLTMILYNLMLWINLRQPILLAYVAFGTTLLMTIFSFQGIYRVFHFGLPLVWFFYGVWLGACLMSAAMIAIAVYFFDTRRNMPRMHRWFKVLLAGLGVDLLWILMGIGDNALLRFTPLMHLWLVVIYLSLIVAGIAGVRLKLTGAAYYLAGHGILLMALVLTNMAQLGWIGSVSMVSVIVPTGALLDITFLAKAISERLGRMQRELELQRESALVQSRFASVGKTLGMITHQWRTPLARQGAALTEMEMLLKQEGREAALPRIEQVLLPRVQECLALLSGTVTDFRSYFAADNVTRRFAPAEIIDQTLGLIAWQRQPDSLRIEWRRPDADIVLDSHPATLAHVMMIIVENAIDIFAERQVADPVLSISLSQEGHAVRIAVTDNGGGIRVRPIERIFSGFFSAKQRQSTGMGLYIARMLVEERLGGRITAENTRDGACLSLSLPNNGRG